MNYRNEIRSLYRTNDAAAQAIMQQYPPQWDMDRVFQKAYQGYLAQKKEQLQTEILYDSELAETVEYTTETRISHSIRRYGGYAGLAAAMIGVFLLVFKGFSMRTPVDQIPDETVPPIATTSETEVTTNTTEETTYETTAVSAFIPSSTTAPETTASAAESTHTETSAETDQIVTETVTSVTESIRTQAEESVTSDSAETSVTTTETSTESTQETTTTTTETTTTAPPVVPLGRFEVSEQSGSFYQITYVREDTSTVEEHAHSFAADGFTLTSTLVQNPDYDFRSVIYNLEDAAGQSYMVQEYRYAYFMPNFSSEYYPLTKSYTIGGKTVFLVYQDDPEAVCHLMWDDGCHVCEITSQYKDLANMELLAQSQITE